MAAEDIKNKKRKGAPEASPKPKKQKKSDGAAVGTRKSSRSQGSAVAPKRPRAEDFFSDDEASGKKVSTPKGKKAKKIKTVAPADEEMAVKEKPKKKAKKAKEPAVEAAEKKSTKAKKSLKEDTPVEDVDIAEAIAETNNADDDEDLDDQTAALLAGFESDRDESDEDKGGEYDEKDVTVPELSKKQRKALEKVRKDSEPGVVFLGRVPHGFFESQMKQYFRQFGDVTRLRLSRNKKTGASKHYAFIEFANGDVADIVAKTMHNYLMFGHILQCKTIPSEQVHPELFKGSYERFKVDPRNKKAGIAMVKGTDRAHWEKRVAKENENRTKQTKMLKEDFDYDFSAPAVMAVEDVPRQVDTAAGADEQLQLEAPAAEVLDIIEIDSTTPGQVTVTETVTVKKGKKSAKAKVESQPDTNGAVETAEPVPAPKAKKDKKRKSDIVVEATEEAVVDAPAPKPKKAKAAKAADDDATPDKKRKVKVAEQEGAKVKKAKKSKA